MALSITCFSDPGCPVAYSARPALSVLGWRYGDQLDWSLLMIGLSERRGVYESRGYTTAKMAHSFASLRRYGMPFEVAPRAQIAATGRACRALVAVRRLAPERVWAAYLSLQLAWFTTTGLPDEDATLAAALEATEGIDAVAVMAELDSPETAAAYEDDRARARRAAGGATEFQGKAAATDGPVRFTAPSLVFDDGAGRTFEAGGFQPVEVYDAAIANLDRTLRRREPPSDPVQALAAFPDGLSTQEVAAIMAEGFAAPDRAGAEALLVDAVAGGRATRLAHGDDAFWRAA